MGSCSLENRGDLALHTGLGGQVQMSLVKYPAVWRHLGLLWREVGLRSWLEEMVRDPLLFIVVVLEAVHLSLISLAVGLISPMMSSLADGLAGDHGVPLTRLFRL
jgi:hypothetical protein